MAKRRGAEEEEGLDSLLDTMFNVVGILIIVLVVVQLGMQESVKQIANSMSVDPLALEQLIKDLEEAGYDSRNFLDFKRKVELLFEKARVLHREKFPPQGVVEMVKSLFKRKAEEQSSSSKRLRLSPGPN